MVTILPSNRTTTYDPVTPTTAFPVVFPLFDNDDLLIEINGDPRTDYVVSATYINGVSTDASIIMSTGVTGSVVIYGMRSPRRTDQFLNGGPLPIENFNYALNRLTIENQESRRDIDKSRVDLDEEISERKAADVTLQANIDLEAAQRAFADAALTGGLAAETLARQVADITINGRIDGLLGSVSDAAIRAEAAADEAEGAANAAQQLVIEATAGFSGFLDGQGYDFGYITDATTYFDQNWGTIV
ncbi:hypothetical protein G6L30_17350 [Agrobacterium rhizogenes]|nr:hypothetical protein [Rhizobium rhizogenes]